MKLVAFGILAAMLRRRMRGREAGDPGEPAGGATEHSSSLQATPKVHSSVTAAGASSAVPPNPEPSPWFPTDPGMAEDDSTGNNPEPSPWIPKTPTAAAGTSTDPETGGTGATSGNSGSSPRGPGHHGSL